MKRFKKSGEINNYDIYKVIAFVAMIADHIGLFLVRRDDLMLRVLGRISNLIYSVLFGINKKKNPDRILVYGIIMNIILTHRYNRIFPLGTLINFYISNLLLEKLYDIYCGNVWLFSILLALLLPLGIFTGRYLEYGIFILALTLCGKIFIKEEKTPKDIIVTSIIFILYFFYQLIIFGFSLAYSLILFVFFCILYIALFNFRFTKIKNIKFKNILMFLSRYSLELFVFQLVVFMILSYVNF
ncbi:MAG: hypothetical protein LBP39_01095 [Rickettsiales bacterium]|nr:hypothetical protein [Rickettsiales bacterium]